MPSALRPARSVSGKRRITKNPGASSKQACLPVSSMDWKFVILSPANRRTGSWVHTPIRKSDYNIFRDWRYFRRVCSGAASLHQGRCLSAPTVSRLWFPLGHIYLKYSARLVMDLVHLQVLTLIIRIYTSAIRTCTQLNRYRFSRLN
jgi:hypothetical protein